MIPCFRNSFITQSTQRNINFGLLQNRAAPVGRLERSQSSPHVSGPPSFVNTLDTTTNPTTSPPPPHMCGRAGVKSFGCGSNNWSGKSKHGPKPVQPLLLKFEPHPFLRFFPRPIRRPRLWRIASAAARRRAAAEEKPHFATRRGQGGTAIPSCPVVPLLFFWGEGFPLTGNQPPFFPWLLGI